MESLHGHKALQYTSRFRYAIDAFGMPAELGSVGLGGGEAEALGGADDELLD